MCEILKPQFRRGWALVETLNMKLLRFILAFLPLVAAAQSRNVARVVLTGNELVASPPETFYASLPNSTDSLAYVTTTGDYSARTGRKDWVWDPLATGATNATANNGPIAYPYGATMGRWIYQPITALPQVSFRLMRIPGTYPDAADGTPNATDPVTEIQDYIDAASAAYTAIEGKVSLEFPQATFTGGQFFWRSKVRYFSPGEFVYKKRYDASGSSERSICTTARMGGEINGMATLHADGSFLAWRTEGGTNNYYADPTRWYGLSDDMEFDGPGWFTFDQNLKNVGQPLVRFVEVRRMEVNRCIRVIHNGTALTANSYAVQLCGEIVNWLGIQVLGGREIYQDGLHMGWGKYINVQDGYIESGDDAIAYEAETAGGSTLPPDQPLENCRVSGITVNSYRARAASVTGGVNQIGAPYPLGGLKVYNCEVSGLFGKVGQLRQGALHLGDYQTGGQIWSYTIVDPGTGYTDGTYQLAVGNTGGGTGAECTVTVSGGIITRAVPRKLAGVWKWGSGYTTDEAVTITGMGAGSGASVTAVVYGPRNDTVLRTTIHDFNLVTGGPAHDGTEPFAIKFYGATDSKIYDGKIHIIQNSGTPAHRPFFVQAGKHCSIENVDITAEGGYTKNGGGIALNTHPKTLLDDFEFLNCSFPGIDNTGQGTVKINGTAGTRLGFRRCRFNVRTGQSAFYLPDIESSKACHIDILDIQDCIFAPFSGATSTRAVNFVDNGGTHNMVGFFRFVGNYVEGITTSPTVSVLQAGCTAYEIDGNTGGWLTKLRGKVTQTSGTTSFNIPISTVTGLPANTDDWLTMVRVQQLGATTPVAYTVDTSSTTQVTVKTPSAPGSNVTWGYYVDTSRK